MATKKAATKKAPAEKAATKKVATGSKKKAAATEVKAEPRPAPAIGSPAPAFSLLTNDGAELSLDSLKGQKVVLYFYPKDDTPGCTTEACGFRDGYAAIQAKGAVILGVSRDSVAAHQKFRTKYSLPFQLLSDPSAEMIAAYGSWGPKKFMGREFMGILRTTVLIDRAGRIAKIYPKVSPAEHAAQVLADLDGVA